MGSAKGVDIGRAGQNGSLSERLEMKPKETPWFPGTTKPVHIGVYKRKYYGVRVFYCYWNGVKFRNGADSPLDAVLSCGTISIYQDLPWRGLTKDVAKDSK